MLSKEELFNEAKIARNKAYAPYSHFAVGAVIECKDGTLIYGANIENAAYGLSLCAERNAIFQAFLKGYRSGDYLQMAIVADSDIVTTPCGSCRQVLAELFDADVPFYCFDMEGKFLKTTVRELLPHGFNKENLSK